MVKGRYGGSRKAPYIEAWLTFGQEGESSGAVSLLIDTGADRTMLNAVDARKINLDFETMGRREVIHVVGGDTEVYWCDGMLVFDGLELGLFGYNVEIGVFSMANRQAFPSLLGRDVINAWRLTLDHSQKEISAEIVRSDHRFAVP